METREFRPGGVGVRVLEQLRINKTTLPKWDHLHLVRAHYDSHADSYEPMHRNEGLSASLCAVKRWLPIPTSITTTSLTYMAHDDEIVSQSRLPGKSHVLT
jgi:hypothetical protein